MSRDDLREIIERIIENVQTSEDGAPEAACIWSDTPEPPGCEDVVMRYAIPNPN